MKKNTDLSNRLQRINSNWQPLPHLHTKMQERYPNLSIDNEIERMINWAIDQDKKSADWSRRFMNWCNKAEEFRKKNYDKNSPVHKSPQDVLARIQRASKTT